CGPAGLAKRRLNDMTSRGRAGPSPAETGAGDSAVLERGRATEAASAVFSPRRRGTRARCGNGAPSAVRAASGGTRARGGGVRGVRVLPGKTVPESREHAEMGERNARHRVLTPRKVPG